ncbi:early nodulin-like protein 1, partial [Setaria italica]|uniref:early nodulin-like protein 1 n=1 Tax=Setaria italica TaxID=4555 RepID=UPI000BE56BBC
VGSASASWHAQVFEVGGEPRGWAKPAAPNGETYNHWAARNRFHVGDFLHKYSYFKYDKNDSVLVVSRDDYKFCDAVRPSQRFDGGDTRLRLENSGFSYFISGAPGHCDAGQRMTLRVLPQQQQQDGGSEAAPTGAPGAMAPGGAAGGGGGGDEGGEFGPPHGSGSGSGVVGTDANNTSGAAPARAPSSFGGCCHHVVGAVVLGASLLVLGA